MKPTSTAHKPTERVLNILQLLSTNPEGFTLTEIAEAIQAPKSTIFPVIQTMLERRFISLNKSTLKYSIGISAFCIGASYSSGKNVLDFIKKEMEYIVGKINETCQMGILDGGNVLYVLKEDSMRTDIRLVSHIGKRLPAYCTAIGKALLQEYDLEELKALYPDGLKPMTEKTITDFEVLAEQLKKINEDKIATDFEEVTKYLVCLAVPLSAQGKTIASISISLPIFRATEEKVNLAKQLLLNAKEKIETYFSAIHADLDSFVLTDRTNLIEKFLGF